jgi:chromate transporter
VVVKKEWLSDASFHDGVALCQMIPGAPMMQVAAYVGLRTQGIGGAAASYTTFGLPAFLLMLILSALYVRTHALPAVGFRHSAGCRSWSSPSLPMRGHHLR